MEQASVLLIALIQCFDTTAVRTWPPPLPPSFVGFSLRTPPTTTTITTTTTTLLLTWITLMFSPVSWASCSRMCRVGFGVATNAAFNVSSCLALMVVLGPRLFVPEFCSSFSILFVSLSDDVELSVSLMSSCVGSCRSGDKLRSVHDDTDGEEREKEGGGQERERSHDLKCQKWRRRRGKGLLCTKRQTVWWFP